MQKNKSVRTKLFLTLVITVIIIIVSLIVLNNVVLGSFYLYSKRKDLLKVYDSINNYYNSENSEIDIDLELEKVSIKNNFDILIKNEEYVIYSSDKNFPSRMGNKNIPMDMVNKDKIIYSKDKVIIQKSFDNRNGLNYIMLSTTLDNGYTLDIRVAIASIEESVKVSNNFLCIIGILTIIISGIIIRLPIF